MTILSRTLSLIAILFIVCFTFQSAMHISTPQCNIHRQSLNRLITNDLSNFNQSEYIAKEVNNFRNKWELKGVSIAVVKDEQLVYAQGFGETNDYGNQTEPYNIFRVASASKLITATAIMKLVEDKKISLNTRVFGPRGIINNSIFDKVKDKRVYNITVRQLLAHTAGWTQRNGDPAFNSIQIANMVGDAAPATLSTYYKFIANSRLRFTPGQSYSYSNIGYMVLEGVIERVTGENYEEYVRKHILIPNGINDMHLGNSYHSELYDNEVCYYEPPNSLQIPSYDGGKELVSKANGGNPIRLLGAAGGWVCSSVELAKLMTLLDGQGKDILHPRTISQMTNSVPGKGPLGWKTTQANGTWIRTGSMAGTMVMLKRMGNGYSWVFLSNTSSWKGYKLERNIEYLMSKILHNVDEWPNINLFEYISEPNQNDIPLAYFDKSIETSRDT